MSAATLPRVVYLAGSGRSGSTALAQVLEQRLDLVHLGEVRFLWERGVGEDHLCQCGQPFSACPVWQGALGAAHPDGVPSPARLAALRSLVDRMRHVPRLARSIATRTVPDDVRRWADVVAPLYAALAAQHGGRPLLDSSKDPSYLYALAASRRIDLRVVHLVRDSRAVAFSWTRRRRRPEVHDRETYMQTLRPWRSATLWLGANGVLEAYRRLDPTALRVRYEDFARRPDQVVARVAEHFDLAARAPTAAPVEAHSFSGNPIRFDRGPLRIRLDEEWRTALGRLDRARVTAVTAPLLARYGYLGPAVGR